MVRLVLFDIDGKLIRTGGAGVKAFKKVFETVFQATDGFEALKFAGRTDYGIVREFFGVHGIRATPGNFQLFFDRYVFWLDQILQQQHIEICRGVRKFIGAVNAEPEPPLLGLLTGNIRLGAEIKLRRAGLWELFQTGGFADDHEERDSIAAVARERGCGLLREKLRGDQVLVIGDTPLDIRCARAIGARALAIATGGARLEELQGHDPDWVVADLTAVSPKEVLH